MPAVLCAPASTVEAYRTAARLIGAEQAITILAPEAVEPLVVRGQARALAAISASGT